MHRNGKPLFFSHIDRLSFCPSFTNSEWRCDVIHRLLNSIIEVYFTIKVKLMKIANLSVSSAYVGLYTSPKRLKHSQAVSSDTATVDILDFVRFIGWLWWKFAIERRVHHNMASNVQLPSYFVPNVGQVKDTRIQFVSRGAGIEALFTSSEVIFTFSERTRSIVRAHSTFDLPSREKEVRSTRLDFRFLNASPGIHPQATSEMDSKVHYFKGANPSNWYTDIPAFLRIFYAELWPGINLVFRSEGAGIKYEFIVQPGANEDFIRFAYAGAEKVSLDEEGNLVVDTAIGALIDPRPVCYQEIDGQRSDVPGSFILVPDDDNLLAIGFQIGESYDRSAPLIIDPGLVYSTYLGGSGNDEPFGIAVDATGSVYVTGITTSTDFPLTPGAVQTTFGGDREVFVTKLNPSGTALVYSTYLGGSANDSGQNIAVDAEGNAYITGRTYSDNFPVTPGAVQTIFGGSSDVFVTKLNPTGSALVYSTYLGGTGHDYGLGIAVDSAGEAYVTGFTASADFPTTTGAFQTVYGGNNDGFAARLNATGTSLIYSTFLGGSGGDNGTAISVDSAGNAYVTGNTASLNFPTTTGAFQTARRGTGDVFVTKINPSGSSLVYSTYLGDP
ncbi:SBBP repeat-containing protein [Paenibacillus protaetiae]|uniref:DUF7948 domain-containing protein n=1 Tax=Paenibacillus protaetiae TaxID=2509456 RepID=A0A4P6ERN0_9BACL|nr:SBBP repeat-containing protein [Paenibacillus protaetiae]QAY65095.1 hypothetical protein ET464_00515 [Paenibacillus protaetiae]